MDSSTSRFLAHRLRPGELDGGLFDLAPYRDQDAFFHELARLTALDSERATLTTYGESVEGRPLYRLTLNPPPRSSPDTREVLVTSLIHGCEFIGGEVCLGIIRRLIEDEARVPWIAALRTRARFVFAPMLNPDAYARNVEQMQSGRWAWVRRKNAQRVDLNRNFPYPPGRTSWHPLSGSKHTWHQSYMGPHPLSEPETRFLAEMVRAHKFRIAFNFHSFGGLFLFPPGHTKTRAPDFERFVDIGLTFRDHQPHVPYKVRQSIGMYPTIGDLDDWMYEELGALSFTIEVSHWSHVWPRRVLHPFWWMNPVNRDFWVANDCDAALHALARGLDIT